MRYQPVRSPRTGRLRLLPLTRPHGAGLCLGSLINSPREEMLVRSHRQGLRGQRRCTAARLRGGVRAVNPGAWLSGPRTPAQAFRGASDPVPPGQALPPRRRSEDSGRPGLMRGRGSAHRCLENSSFLPRDEERAPQAQREPRRSFGDNTLTESGDDQLAANEQHGAVLGAAGERGSGCSSPLGAASEMPGTAQAGPAPAPRATALPARCAAPRPARRVPGLLSPPGSSSRRPPCLPPARPPAATPAAAHLRARRPPGLPTPGVRSRPAAPPTSPLAPPPRSRNRSLPGSSSRLRQAQCDVTSGRRAVARAGSPGLANAPGASPEPGARPRMTTNSSRGGGGGVRRAAASGLAASLPPLRHPPSVWTGIPRTPRVRGYGDSPAPRPGPPGLERTTRRGRWGRPEGRPVPTGMEEPPRA